MPYVTVEEEVWVDLDAFDTEDLVEELKLRGVSPPGNTRLRTIVGATLDAAEESMQAKQQDTKELKASEKDGKEGKVID